EALAGMTLETPLKMGINGCARCCVPTHTLDTSIIGDTRGCRVRHGGKNSQIPARSAFMAEGVPAGELPALVAKVVALYKEHAQEDESLQDVMDRVGSAPYIQALAPYSQDAHGGEDPFAAMGASDDESNEQSGVLDGLDEVGDF